MRGRPYQPSYHGSPTFSLKIHFLLRGACIQEPDYRSIFLEHCTITPCSELCQAIPGSLRISLLQCAGLCPVWTVPSVACSLPCPLSQVHPEDASAHSTQRWSKAGKALDRAQLEPVVLVPHPTSSLTWKPLWFMTQKSVI